MKIEKLEKQRNTKELLPQIVKRIFAICRTDPHFPLKNEMESVDDRIQNISEKIEKQNDLLNQSSELKKDFGQRIDVLKNENTRKQSQLLEQLGSEL